MSIEITEELVRHVARLARLSLSETELAEAREHFRKVLAYVAELDAVDTEGIDPAAQPAQGLEALREDAPGPSLDTAEALRNAPGASPPFFVVPKIIDAGEATEGSEGAA